MCKLKEGANLVQLNHSCSLAKGPQLEPVLTLLPLVILSNQERKACSLRFFFFWHIINTSFVKGENADCYVIPGISVVLFGEPVRWETSLQLIIDVLLTSGYPGNRYGQESYPHIPVLACNMDLMWVAEAQSPRDNVMTDVYGANLYNRYLQQSCPRLAPAGTAPGLGWDTELLAPAAAARCSSVLVCTGVYDPQSEGAVPSRDSVAENVFHGHRDFSFDPALVEPDHIVPDVDAAVDLVFQLENFAPR
uniref:HDHD5 hydrolase n=1 Tax=Junco hyemalis TaxID=40217 RepID=A0A8C5IL03_JUNHY